MSCCTNSWHWLLLLCVIVVNLGVGLWLWLDVVVDWTAGGEQEDREQNVTDRLVSLVKLDSGR